MSTDEEDDDDDWDDLYVDNEFVDRKRDELGANYGVYLKPRKKHHIRSEISEQQANGMLMRAREISDSLHKFAHGFYKIVFDVYSPVERIVALKAYVQNNKHIITTLQTLAE